MFSAAAALLRLSATVTCAPAPTCPAAGVTVTHGWVCALDQLMVCVALLRNV